MSQQVQELIDKIKNEGIEQAESKASEITAEAQKQAQQIIADAKAQAEQILNDAKTQIAKQEESSQKILQQASRDTLLSLRKSVESILNSIVQKEVGSSLDANKLSDVISNVVKESSKQAGKDSSIEVLLNAKDLKAVGDTFISKLQKEIKEPLNIQSSDDVAKGFTISYDSGKSSFDFTDESLAEYFRGFLNNQISAIVQEATK